VRFDIAENNDHPIFSCLKCFDIKSDVEKGFDIQWFKQFRDALLNTVY
jgi:hypothetical protein